MTLPGTTVTIRDTPPPRSAPTDSSVWFVAGITEQGPAAPVLIESLDDFIAAFGQRVSYGLLYDALDVFFHEGGAKAYVSRVFGPTPVQATHNFLDGSSAVSLVIKAKTAGDWGNTLSLAIVAGVGGGTFQIQVQKSGVVVEQSGDLATQADAVAWGANSQYVTVALGVASDAPATVAAQALAGGTDDHGNATDATWKTALDLFTADLGPGQVSMPGRTTQQSHTDQLAHAQTRNRVAILDAPDTATVATLLTNAAAGRSAAGARNGGVFAPWAIVPGVIGGITRTVPYSAVEAGIMARNDSAGESPNVPAAGIQHGQSNYALGLSQAAWSDADREALNNGGVNVARVLEGAVVTYGYRTLVDPTTDPTHLPLSNARMLAEIVAQADAIGERYVFSEIDGRGFAFSDFAGDLAAMLNGYWNEGSLYGATPQEAYAVDVGSQVNTPTTIADRQFNASIELKLSPYGERVQVFITKKQLTEVI